MNSSTRRSSSHVDQKQNDLRVVPDSDEDDGVTTVNLAEFKQGEEGAFTRNQTAVVQQTTAPPIKVGMAFQVYHLFAISEAEGEFSCTFSLHLEWVDSKQKGGVTGKKGWKPSWHPPIIFHNNVRDTKILYSTFTLKNSATGEVTWDIQYRCRFHTEFELSRFPFDRQLLLIKAATVLPQNVVQFVPHSTRQNTQPRENMPEWCVAHDPTAHFAHVTSSAGVSFEQYVLCLYIQRRYQYYLWNVVFVMSLITAMAALSFTVPVDQTWDRLSVTLTLVLTAMAFKFVVAEKMPRLSYLTYLDKYMSLSFFFLFMIAVENGVAQYFPRSMWDVIDFYFFTALFIIWTVYNGLSFFLPMTGLIFPSWESSKKLKQLVNMEENHFEHVRQTYETSA